MYLSHTQPVSLKRKKISMEKISSGEDLKNIYWLRVVGHFVLPFAEISIKKQYK